MPVQVAPVRREAVPVRFEINGTVLAVRRATLAARVAGTIDRLNLQLGQAVRAGDVLLAISSPDLSARAVQARAQLAQVERELARERTLLSSGAGTRDAVQSLEDRLPQTQAAVREAESLLAFATVRAPFDGTVARKFVEAGDYATAGAPLLQLDGREAFEIEVGVPDSLAATLAPGAALDVEIPTTTARFRAPVRELSSAADATARTTTARLAVPAGTAVRPGLFVRVSIPGPSVSALLVPAAALTTFGQMERVFTVSPDHHAALRLVKTGARHGDTIEIVSGLDAGERVVLSPPATLRDGQPLQLARP